MFIGKTTTKSWDIFIFVTSQLPIPKDSLFLVGESEITAHTVERMFYFSKREFYGGYSTISSEQKGGRHMTVVRV